MKRLAISIVRCAVHVLLLPLEWWLTQRKGLKSNAPIFIIGAPRSGTSLLYELLVTRFRVSYISNLSHRFYLTPVAAAWLGRRAITKWRGNFQSRYGHIAGWGAPNEGGWVWLRWLADGDWTDGSAFDEGNTAPLQRTVAGISTAMNAPFINKNVMHSNRLLLMQKIWPDALFIQVRREFADNARSIVRAERTEGGPQHDADHWWSVRPSNAKNHLGSDDIQRACAQVAGVDADIARDFGRIGTDRLLIVEYADLCAQPEATMQAIASFTAKHSITLLERFEVPDQFNPPLSKPLGDEEEMLLQNTLSRRPINAP